MLRFENISKEPMQFITQTNDVRVQWRIHESRRLNKASTKVMEDVNGDLLIASTFSSRQIKNESITRWPHYDDWHQQAFTKILTNLEVKHIYFETMGAFIFVKLRSDYIPYKRTHPPYCEQIHLLETQFFGTQRLQSKATHVRAMHLRPHKTCLENAIC